MVDARGAQGIDPSPSATCPAWLERVIRKGYRRPPGLRARAPGDPVAIMKRDVHLGGESGSLAMPTTSPSVVHRAVWPRSTMGSACQHDDRRTSAHAFRDQGIGDADRDVRSGGECVAVAGEGLVVEALDEHPIDTLGQAAEGWHCTRCRRRLFRLCGQASPMAKTMTPRTRLRRPRALVAGGKLQHIPDLPRA